METPTDPSKQLLKPKQEPRQEIDSPPAASGAVSEDDGEITPLSGEHPFFTIVMSRSQVQRNFQLTIPLRFQRRLPEARVPAVLLCCGRSWAASYCGDLKVKKLDAAWRDFVAGNRLRVGDACVFELIATGDGREKGQLVFRVQVLRGGLPAEVTSRGATSDDPMVIVD
ncbi:hypothetical protein ACP70R_042145 [Stipagrostis hirtigluma subsp. patula]